MRIAVILLVLIASTAYAQDRVVFEIRLDVNNWDIFIMNADGSWPKNLTNGAFAVKNIDPAISPSGKEMAFSSNSNGPSLEIFVMNLTSRTVRHVTNDFFTDHAPSWSPDGQRIVFGRCNSDQTICDLFTTNANGSGNLIPLANSPQDDDRPRFSPNGLKVAFMSNRDGNYEIYVCDVNGSNPLRLTTNSVVDGWPVWSPDGTKIIFSSRRDSSTYELYSMNADGSNVTRLTHDNNVNDFNAAFSTDGQRLAWQRWLGSTFEIVETALSDMSQPKRITFEGVDNRNPDYGFVTRKLGRFH